MKRLEGWGGDAFHWGRRCGDLLMGVGEGRREGGLGITHDTGDWVMGED